MLLTELTNKRMSCAPGWLITFGLLFLFSANAVAKPSHRFKELVLHERIIPFDDSMDSDEYYVNVDDSNRNDQLSSAAVHSSVPVLKAGKDSQFSTDRDKGRSSTEASTPLVSTSAVKEEAKTTQRSSIDADDHDDHSDRVGKKSDADDDDEELDDDDQDAPKFHDPCRNVYCRTGRVCRPDVSGHGECVCGDASLCHGSSKKVCGTDGFVYPSHCELHRSACLKHIHISADHSGKRCSSSSSNDSTTQTSLSSASRAEAMGLASEGDLGDVKDASRVKSVVLETCTSQKLKQLLSDLVAYHCLPRFGNQFNCSNVHNKRIIIGNIFSYYDRNGDRYLNSSELKDAEDRDHVKELSVVCHLTDMLRLNEDGDTDGRLSVPEFFSAFDISVATLDDNLKVYTTSVTIGNSVELKCDVKGIDRILWKRKGHSIDGAVDKQIRVFDDGSLYIGDMRLDHMGNYTCQDRMSNDVIQTHVLLLQTLPQVQVHPLTQIHLSGSTVTLKCRADGVPQPELTWEKNEWPISAAEDSQQRYLFLHNNSILEIKSADFKYDTGAYKCKAKNAAGTSDQIAAVFVENVSTSKHSLDLKQSELFAVFHDRGYTVYEVGHCHTEHQVAADFHGFKVSPGSQKTPNTLCPANESCSWLDVVIAKNKFVYVAQPKLRRIVVIEMDRSNPVEVIPIEGVPIKLNYVEHLDEVWVTCLKNEHSDENTGSKVIFIIRQASSEHPHFASLAPLTTDGLDEVTSIFLSVSNSLKHDFEYGYVVHGNKMAMHKLHLASMVHAKEISLSEYNCFPRSIQFIPTGGLIFVGCVVEESQEKPSFHLLLDYITDGLLERLEVNGDSYLSPDGRNVIVVGDHGNTVFVFKTSDDGQFRHVFDEYTQLHLDDVAFFPSESGFDYSAFITSSDQPSILHLDLESGRVSITEGLGQALGSSRFPKVKHNRIIVSGGPFAEHLMTSSNNSAVVIDGRRRRIQCEWQDVSYGNLIVSLPDTHRD